MQKFEAGPSDPELEVRNAEVGSTSKACERSERSIKASTDC